MSLKFPNLFFFSVSQLRNPKETGINDEVFIIRGPPSPKEYRYLAHRATKQPESERLEREVSKPINVSSDLCFPRNVSASPETLIWVAVSR